MKLIAAEQQTNKQTNEWTKIPYEYRAATKIEQEQNLKSGQNGCESM